MDDDYSTPDRGAYCPGPEEIAERARQVREEGFWGRGQKTTEAKQFYPPWEEKERFKRMA